MNQKSSYIPVITISLAVINVLAFFLLEILGDTEDVEFMMQIGAVYPSYLIEDGEYWRLLTATFMHFGFEHLLNNMLILLCAGSILEKALGHIKFVILYLCAGVGGSTLSFLQMVKSKEYAVSAGASGAIFGIIGALLWIVIRHKGRYETLTGRGLLFMIALSLYYGIRTGGIDNWGHIGGLVMGFVLGVLSYRKKPKEVDFDGEKPYTYI